MPRTHAGQEDSSHISRVEREEVKTIPIDRIGQRLYRAPAIRGMAALQLWRRGEADTARVTLKARRQTVRQFLRVRFGIVTGAREYWHRENWTPDHAGLQEFIGALREARRAAWACPDFIPIDHPRSI
jgi:hypothetical protein